MINCITILSHQDDSPHHLLHGKYNCNTRTTMIDLTNFSPAKVYLLDLVCQDILARNHTISTVKLCDMAAIMMANRGDGK